MFIYASIASLTVWLILLLLNDLLEASALHGMVPSRLTSSWVQIQLAAWGFAGLMIFAMGYVLIPSFIGRRLAKPWASTLHLPLAVVGLLLVVTALVLRSTLLWRVGAALWLAGAILFALNLMATRREALRPSVRGPKPSTLGDRVGLIMVGFAMAYLQVSSLLFLLFDPVTGRTPVGSMDYWSVLHLYLLGFVVMMIFGVGYNLLPRFLAARPSRVLLYVNAAAAVPPPVLFALFIIQGGPWLALGGALFTVAFASFALNIILMYLRRTREAQPTFYFLFGALASLTTGIALGILFILSPALRYLSPVHAELNLFGFVGMTIFGVSYYVFPYFPKGSYFPSYVRPMTHLTLASTGLILSVPAKLHRLLAGPGFPWIIVAGEVLMLASVVVYISCMHRMLTAIWRLVAPEGLPSVEANSSKPNL